MSEQWDERLREAMRKDLARVEERLYVARRDRYLLDGEIADLERTRTDILLALLYGPRPAPDAAGPTTDDGVEG